MFNYVNDCLCQNNRHISLFLWIHRGKQNANLCVTIDKIVFIFHKLCLSSRRIVSTKKKERRNSVSLMYLKTKRHRRKKINSNSTIINLVCFNCFKSRMWKRIQNVSDTVSILDNYLVFNS